MTEFALVKIGRASPRRIAEALQKAGIGGVRVSEAGCWAPVSDRLWSTLARAPGATADWPEAPPPEAEELE